MESVPSCWVVLSIVVLVIFLVLFVFVLVIGINARIEQDKKVIDQEARKTTDIWLSIGGAGSGLILLLIFILFGVGTYQVRNY
jgi:hypothetical protein